MDITLKQRILDYCKRDAQERVNRILEVMKRAQETANEDTKSSAGDKYETGRAMMHLEQEKNQRRLTEAQQLVETLSQVPITKKLDTVAFGSLIETNVGKFFIAVSLGQIMIGGVDYFVISTAAPISKVLLGKRVGETASINGRVVEVIDIC